MDLVCARFIDNMSVVAKLTRSTLVLVFAELGMACGESNWYASGDKRISFIGYILFGARYVVVDSPASKNPVFSYGGKDEVCEREVLLV